MVILSGFGGQKQSIRARLQPALRLSAWSIILWATISVRLPAVVCAQTPSAVAPQTAPTPPAAGLRVTFWNLQWFPGHRPGAGPVAQRNHVAMVLPALARLRPDVLGLEEVGDLPAAHLLADRLPGFHVDACTQFVRGPNQEPSRQQIVLCSRLPLLTAGWQTFRADARGTIPRRGFAYAVYQPAPGETVLVYALHLKSNVPDEPGGEAANVPMREESIRQLLVHRRDLLAASARWGRPRLEIIGGDMNTSLDDPRFQHENTLRALLTAEDGFRWAWQGCPLPLRLTLPGAGPYPSACFDHIFYRGADARLLAAELGPPGRGVSDHRPVSALFGW